MTDDREEEPGLAMSLAGSLWFPLLFFFGFLFCYMLPFHSPSPHDVRVAVSPPAVAARLGPALDRKAPGAFEVVPVKDASAARKKILTRQVVAAYAVEGPARATLYVAKADGTFLEQAATSTFTAVAQQGGQSVRSVELVPTAKGDVTGTGLFYLSMAWNIAPYIAVMMLMRAVTLSRGAKVLTLAAMGAFMAVVGFYIALAMDVVPNKPVAIVYGFLITQAVAQFAYGLVPFVRQFIPGVAITLFVLLSIPSSGGAIPYQLVPGFFRALHPVMPLGNLLDALHGLFYFGNEGLLRPTLVLCAWVAAGFALVGFGAYLQHRKAAQAEPGATAEEELVEDPTFEVPVPHAVSPAHHEHFGDVVPGLVGTVRTASGDPVADALVTVLATGGHQLMRTRTDDEGRYAAAGLPEDFVTVLLLARAHTPAVARVLLTAGRTHRQDFVLETPVHGAHPA
ncbi:carboxypeptidase regulatory-like domain-containing protein [Actinomadura opuntiae]|uniref:carboxypeptidase regulatory-like domain-containing protein n=1 Tax=Actinomadura sp. OS1-43 TaxID=604315 RepID=UPI00255A76B2|nr:carboxypeptidase regulatory-like domain-containing protein [Actinomadura sp. OS1-43]MDL4817899.1 carboxypeptidase regulatory-like domain-containing protein [Actinomadura sp. OS1-43]